MNHGLDYLLSFIPGCSSPNLLENTLIGRKKLVDGLEKRVVESSKTGNKHQQLIIGPRGSGKTHTLKVLYDRIQKRTQLKNKLAVAYLAEEEYGVATFLDWLIRILRAFVRWNPTGAGHLEKEIEMLKETPPNDRERIASRVLLNYVEKKTVLIIVENIGRIFDEKKGFGRTGQAKFRDFLQQHPVFTILASGREVTEDIRRADRPFYGFFNTIQLQPLTADEASGFLEIIASREQETGLLNFLGTPKGKGFVRAVYDLTGGNHRLLLTVYHSLRIDFSGKLSDQLVRAIDKLIPYYQRKIDRLSTLQQKIVQHLSQTRKASNVKDIAENCFSAQNTISKQMTILMKQKYVDATSAGKQTFYEISDPLFRICLEVKENRSLPFKQFTDFLAALYTAKEIKPPQKGTGGASFVKEPAVTYDAPDEDQPGDESFKKKYEEIFAKLIRHEKTETQSLERYEAALKETFKDETSMSMALKFLDVGIRHLKKKEKNVLFQLTKEERAVFKKFVLDKIK